MTSRLSISNERFAMDYRLPITDFVAEQFNSQSPIVNPSTTANRKSIIGVQL